MHKPFAYQAGAPRSFPGGDNASQQTAEQTSVHQKWRIGCRKCPEFSPEEMRPFKRESSNTRSINCKVC